MSRRGTESRLGKTTSDVASRPGWLRRWAGRVARVLGLFVLAFGSFGMPPSHAATPAGYSEFFIPVDEDNEWFILNALGGISGTENMHSVISVTAWSDSTVLYYDHWENGYNFDPNNPGATADETCTANTGTVLQFESQVPRPRTSAANCTTGQVRPGSCTLGSSGNANYCYDGRDHVYVAGSGVTMVRAGWPQTTGVVTGIAEEVYPVRPQLTTYILPFGEDIYTANNARLDYRRVFAMIQATEDNTTLQVDFNHDGTFDALDCDHDGTTDGTSCTLNIGQTYRLDQTSDGTGGPFATLDTETRIQGSATLQVQYINGDSAATYNSRAVSAFPRGFWGKEYYAPVPSSGANTDILITNPNATAITITWSSTSTSGSFTVNPNQSVFFQAATGSYVPANSAVYLSGSGVFWAISDVDTNSPTWDWAYSLVPSYFLADEQYLSWSPGCYSTTTGLGCTGTAGERDDGGVFITPAQDHTTVFVDRNNDGTPENTYTLNRLQSQYVYDATDGDMTGAHIWATGPYTLAYGENPATAPTASPGLDAGYTTLPNPGDWIHLVLTVDKSTNPVVLSVTDNPATTTYTLTVESHEFDIGSVSVTDTLAADWNYAIGTDTTTITFPNGSTANTDPTKSGATCGNENGICTLTWSGLGSMAPNQTLTIVFTARTVGTPTYASGALSQNRVKATTTRTVGTVTQTFNATDFVFNEYRDNTVNMQVTKSSSVPEPTPVSPGDTLTYTVNVSNPASSTGNLTAVALNDPMPTGVTYVAGSGSVTCELPLPRNVRDEFSSVAYNNNNGTANWATDWTEADPYETGSTGATGGLVWITGGALQFRYQTMTVLDQFETAAYSNNNGTNHWAGDWTENGDDGSATTTGNGHIYIAAGVLRFDRATSSSFGIQRTANLNGASSVTITFTPTDAGIDAGESVLAEYSLDGGTTWPDIGTYDGGTAGWSGNQQTLTLTGLTASTIMLRFTANGAWNSNGDEFTLNDVQIAFNDAVGSQIRRTVDLTSAVSPTLSFTTASANLDGGGTPDTMVVEASSSSTGPFTTLATATGGAAFSPAGPYDLTPYISATTTVRFRITTNYNATNETRNIDNVDISFYGPTTFASGNPPNFLSSATGCRIRPNNSLTLTYQVTVDNPFPTGQSEILNTVFASAAEIPLPLSASARNIVNTPSQQNAQVSGTVWLDANGNTTIDVGEARLSNVEVTLKDQWGTPIAVTTTDSQGHYLFTNVTPGNGYYTEVTGGLPSGLSQTAPSGHTDNRSNAFNLSAGGNVTDVNLGYRGAAGTATIGDTVWSDANGNGAQDAGEPGIAGVTVRLYTDTNGNGIIDGGETYITTTTGPGGTYLFTGVAAGQNYIVNVPSGQAVLSGYSQTTAFTLGYLNAAANTAYLTADFGFRNTSTYTITDRVWYDANGNGSVNGGETGIAGVTVDLLDNSGNVIATTTTDASGNVTFSGVANGTYRLRVTDTGGKLVDYYGTTSYAQAALRTGIVVSGANVTNTSFGYNLSRAIGDTVFNDNGAGGGTAGNGVQDGTEPGISGVTVKLYSDANGNGVINVGDTLLATLTTDANGHYLFSGLANGNYIVSIESPPSGYTYTATGQPADSDAGTAGQQRAASISGGVSDLDNDFGYWAPTSYILSGRLWNDLNDNGADNSEAGLANVTIQLLQGGTVVGTATTDSNGNYSFSGLPAGTYTVKVTDSNGVLVGYNTTYEKTEGALAGSYNGQEAVTLGPSVSNVSFGYYKPKPTLASIGDFSAAVERGQVVVQWVTEFEIGTVGFHVERWNPVLGVFERITPSMLPGLITSPQGGTYEYVDAGARPDEYATYRLIEIEAWGGQRVHGPYTVRPMASPAMRRVAASLRASESALDGQGHDDPRHGYRATPHALKPKRSSNGLLGLATQAPASVRHALWVAPSGAAQVKVREDGLYLVSSSNLARALNASEPTVRGWIAQGRIKLSNAGQAVAWTAAAGNAGILFYGQAIDSLYTLDNVYRVETVAGNKMMTSVGTPSASQAASVFTETLKFEQDKFAATIVATDPESDYWFWAGFIGDTPGWSSKTFTLEVPDVTGGGTLAVGFSGAAATDHAVEIWLNSHYVGSGSWSGLGAYVLSLPVDDSMLQSGANSVEVRALGTSQNMFYLDRFEVTFQRWTLAVGDRLTLRAAKSGPVAVDGFSVRAISVFDITNPQLPLRLSGTKIVGTGAGYSVTFQAKKGSRYLAVAATAILAETAQAEPGTNLKGRDRVDYAVITTPTLAAGAAQALADYRKTTSLKTRVVLVDDIYTNFNFGIANPHALGSFLRQAARSWGLRYAVLAGVGTLDYRDLLGLAEEQVPTLMTATPFGLYACDGCLGDFDGDGVPEVVVSRIPAGTGADLQAYVAKLKTYEQGTTTLGAAGVLMLAGAADPNAGDFPAESDQVAALLPPAVAVENLSDYDLATARTLMFGRLEGDLGWMNYIGHGNIDRMSSGSGQDLMTTADVAGLQSAGMLPVVSALTCAVNRFEIPGYASLGEELVLQPGGGAIAAWAPTGLSLDAAAVQLDESLFKVVFRSNEPVLGDAVRRSLQGNGGIPPFMRRIYNLLGDGALRLRH